MTPQDTPPLRAEVGPLMAEEAGHHVGWHHCSGADAIDLFLEYRDKHGYDEQSARTAALSEFDEGMAVIATLDAERAARAPEGGEPYRLHGLSDDDILEAWRGTQSWQSPLKATPRENDLASAWEFIHRVQSLFRAARAEPGLRRYLDDVAFWLEAEAEHPRPDPRPAMRQQAAIIRAALEAHGEPQVEPGREARPPSRPSPTQTEVPGGASPSRTISELRRALTDVRDAANGEHIGNPTVSLIFDISSAALRQQAPEVER